LKEVNKVRRRGKRQEGLSVNCPGEKGGSPRKNEPRRRVGKTLGEDKSGKKKGGVHL